MKSSLIIFLWIALMTVGCGSKPPEKKPDAINIAFQGWIGYSPFYLGRDLGFFKDEGIELNIVNEQLDSARRDAFIAGMLDAEAGTLDLLVSKRGQGALIVSVMEIDYSFGADGIVAMDNIQTLADLKGKKVVLSKNDVSDMFLSYLFHEQGLSRDDVAVIAKRPDEVAAAFVNGEGDAAVTWEPELSAAAKRPGSRVFLTSKDQPGFIVDTLNVRQDLAVRNPDLVRRLMRGWFRSMRYAKEHPVEAARLTAKYYGITQAEYQNQIAGLKWVDYKEQNTPANFAKWRDVLNLIVSIKSGQAGSSSQINAVEVINPTLLQKLYENIR
ncbi:MAG: ABC transporter substrate-binding protein [Candidatus Omnitrophica bacterium]|nr:ABC transporter substrate-binding protein [Candidatus Omnitrophota bacterium]